MSDASETLRSGLCKYFRRLECKYSVSVVEDKISSTLEVGKRYGEYPQRSAYSWVRLRPMILVSVYQNSNRRWLVSELYVYLCVRTIPDTAQHDTLIELRIQ